MSQYHYKFPEIFAEKYQTIYCGYQLVCKQYTKQRTTAFVDENYYMITLIYDNVW